VCTITNTRKGTGEKPATLTLKKVVVPSSDPGQFNLQIDGTTYATGGDGTHTGPVTVSAGTHTVGETAAPGTSLSDYTTTYSGDCTQRDPRAVVEVSLRPGDAAVCTITNTRSRPSGKGSDLSISKTVEQVSVPVGSTLLFTLTVQNLGPDPANGTITVTDALPAGFQVPSAGASGPQWNCSVSGANPPATVTCTYTGSVPVPVGQVGGQITIAASSRTAGSFSNCASVALGRSPVPDSDPGNDRSCVDGSITSSGTGTGTGAVKLDANKLCQRLTPALATCLFQVTFGSAISAGTTITVSMPAPSSFGAVTVATTCSGAVTVGTPSAQSYTATVGAGGCAAGSTVTFTESIAVSGASGNSLTQTVTTSAGGTVSATGSLRVGP
jgi:uncharacterized repeat protein (TIGR01451 family)